MGKQISEEEFRLMRSILDLRDGLRNAVYEINKQRESPIPNLDKLHDQIWDLSDKARLALKKG